MGAHFKDTSPGYRPCFLGLQGEDPCLYLHPIPRSGAESTVSIEQRIVTVINLERKLTVQRCDAFWSEARQAAPKGKGYISARVLGHFQDTQRFWGQSVSQQASQPVSQSGCLVPFGW